MDNDLLKYNVPWLPYIPANWEMIPNKRLMYRKKEICKKYKGENILSLSIQGVKIRDINNPNGKLPDTFDGYQYVKKDDLLMCLFDMDVTPRCIGLVTCDGVVSPAYTRFQLYNPQYNKYLYYYYLYLDNNKELVHLSKNLRSSISESQLGQMYVPLPPLDVQNKICSFLDKRINQINKEIEKNYRIIDLLKEFKKSYITENVLGQNYENLKETGIKYISKIPENWELIKGKYILKLLKRDVLKNDDVITCFRDGEVTLRCNRREEGFTFSDKEIGYQGIEFGDLVIHGMDGFAGAIGISDSRGKGSPVLNVLDTSQNKKYIMYYLRSLAYNDVFMALSTGIRVRSCDLSWNKLKEQIFILPSLEEQKKIAIKIEKKLNEIDQIIEYKNNMIEKLEEYKKSIIYEVVTGKVEVE